MPTFPIATVDPDVQIVNAGKLQGVAFIEYLNTKSGERWRLYNTCNRCGLCFVGANDIPYLEWIGPVGQPDAFKDNRQILIDNPCRPEIKNDFPTCTLSGEYL